MLLVCMGAAAYLGAKGLGELQERKAGSDYYARLAGAVSEEASTPAPSEEDLPAPYDAPLAAAGQRSAIDFDALRQTCPDAVGWIRIEGTCIDYPVVHGEDNVYYLSHLPDQTANSAGSIMMDSACDGGFGSTVSILHGHHMRSGAMFGDLDEYADEAYYRAHPVIRLLTPDGDYDVEIFAACTVNGRTFGYPTGFQDAAEFDAFVENLKSETAYDPGVTVEYGDRVLLLSTCAYSFETARFVVAGKIVV